MSIIIKNTRVLVSVTVIAAVFASFTFVQVTKAESIAELQAQLAQLTAQLTALEGVSTTTTRTTVVRSGNSNAACPNTWTRNLTIGSTGDDVLQLQRFLNSDSRTQVASSGAGSPGNESRYYGPITASAVSKFQELYAAQILTPLGLTRGTGGFYTSTRRQANSVCSSAGGNVNVGVTGRTSVSPINVIAVTGDSVGISAGPTIGDGYAIQGAQRLPFTSFVLTAGNDNVRINGIRVRRFGLSNRNQVADVAVVDQDGIQYGSSRSLSSRDEATVGTGISLRAGESKTFAVVGNITNDDTEIDSGATVGFEIYDVTSNTNVVGVGNGLVIRGATHVVSSALTLQTVNVDVTNGGNVELNSDEEVVEVEVEVRGGGNREDGYLKTLILEQDGSANEGDLGDITVLVDDEEVRGSNIIVEGDRYIITFSGNGQLIEEGDSIKVSLQINTNEGSGEEIQFVIDEKADVHVIGAKNGYGLPVTLTDDGKGDSLAEIGTGDISKSRIRGFEDEISYGDDKIVGSLGVEFEGEDVRFEDLTFKVEITGLGTHAVPSERTSASFAESNGEVETLTLDNIRLFVDGEEVASADDVVEIDASESTSGNPALTASGDFTQTGIDFDGSFEIDVRGSSDVRFDIVADLDSDWSYFDSSRIKFTLTDVDEAEGLVSEDDYTAEATNTESAKFFSKERVFEDVRVQGNQISFDFNTDNVSDSEFVAGADSVVFATLEIDADDSSDDVEIKNVHLALTGTKATSGRETGSGVDAETRLDAISNCELVNDGDRIGSQRGSFSKKTDSENPNSIYEVVRFRVSNFDVRAGNTEEVDLVCDIDSDAVAGDSYQFSLFGTPTGTKIEYRIAGDDIDETGSSTTEEGESIIISESGSLDVSFEAPDENLVALSVGSNGLSDQSITTVIFEAEEEDFEIKDVYLTGFTLVGAEDQVSFDKTISDIEITLGNTGGEDFVAGLARLVSPIPTDSNGQPLTTYATSIKFDGVDTTVRKDQEVEFELNVDYRGITDRNGASGQILDLSASKLVVVYEGEQSDKEITTEFGVSNSVKNRVFPTVLTVTESNDPDRTLSNGNKDLYQFTVRASNENAYLNQVGLRIDVTSGVTLEDIELRRGTKEIGRLADITSGVGGVRKIAFTSPEKIKAGQSETYTLHARVGGTADDRSIFVQLIADESASTTVLGAAYSASLGEFIWSPNGLEQDGAITNNLDWFNGYALFESSDIEGWTTDK